MPDVVHVVSKFVDELYKSGRKNIIIESSQILQDFSCSLYFNHCDDIKSDKLLSKSFITLLQLLASLSIARASVILFSFESR